jgi:hypothetical protein
MDTRALDLQEIKRLVKDFHYASSMVGGGANAKNIFQWFVYAIVLAIKVIAVFVIIYLIYYIIFKGYNRNLLNFLTLSMFNSVNLDAFLAEQTFLIENMNYLVSCTNNSNFIGCNPESVYASLYSQGGIASRASDLNAYIDANYSAYRRDKRYIEALKEYYLFHDVLSDNSENNLKHSFGKVTSCDENHRPNSDPSASSREYVIQPNSCVVLPPYDVRNIKYVDFYRRYWIYALKNGRIQRLKKAPDMKYEGNNENFVKNFRGSKRLQDESDAEGEYRLYSIEELGATAQNPNDRKPRTRINGLKDRIKGLAMVCATQTRIVEVNPHHRFLVIPNSIDRTSRYLSDIAVHHESVRSGAIFMPKTNDPNAKYTEYSQVSEFSWLMFEAIFASKDENGAYGFFSNQMNTLLAGVHNDKYIYFASFLNLDDDKRKLAREKTRNGGGYLGRIPEAVYDLVQKTPLFSRIFFSETIRNKASMYKNVICMYRVLLLHGKGNNPPNFMNLQNVEIYDFAYKRAGEAMQNLYTNGSGLTRYILAMNVMDLYFNTYQSTDNINGMRDGMTKMYEQQYLSTEDFAKALWEPYFREVVDYRILPYYRETWSAATLNTQWNNFNIIWRKLGFLLQSAQNTIKKQFGRNPNVKNPPPAETVSF